MAKTQVRSLQIEDEGVSRLDLNVSDAGKAVIRKIIAGDNVALSSSGADSGTGDVTVSSPHETQALSKGGVLTVAAGTHRWYAPRNMTIKSVRASVGVAPTGASVIVDVNKNGTTIFSTQSNRPTIPASGFTDLADAINVTALAAGDYLTIDIDQIGSTIAGSDLTVQIELSSP